MIDFITILTLLALFISEILPFIKNHDANGILHFILNCCTIIIESKNMELTSILPLPDKIIEEEKK